MKRLGEPVQDHGGFEPSALPRPARPSRSQRTIDRAARRLAGEKERINQRVLKILSGRFPKIH
jgi:hypothetical protein